MLRSPRDLHFVFATFGALQSLRNFAPLLALLVTALATLGRKLAFQGSFGGIRPNVASAVPRSAKSASKIRRDGRAPKVATVLHREMKTGISEASKRVSIFSFATQGGKQESFYFRQRNWVQAREAQIRFPAG